MYNNHLVFISLILAAAITEILSSAGTYIRNHKYIEFSYFMIGWMMLSFLGVTQFWYSIVSHNKTECSFFEYSMNTTSAILHYLLSRLIFPDFSSYHFSEKIKNCSKVEMESVKERNDGKYSLGNYYYRNSVALCTVAIMLILNATIHDMIYPLHKDENIIFYKMIFRAAFLIIAFTALITSFYAKNYPDAIQRRKDEYRRSFTGIAYKANLSMIVSFIILFLYYIIKYSNIPAG